MKKETIEKSYQIAKEQYAAIGVDTDKVLNDMDQVIISPRLFMVEFQLKMS